MATTRKSSTTGKPASTPKTTRKTTSRSKTTARATGPAVDPAPDPAVVVNAPTVVVAGVEMKKKELIDLVVERSGIKKRFAKPTIEAALAVLGEAMAEGRPLNLKPMGKVKVHKSKPIAGGQVLMARVRQHDNDAEESGPAPLAEAAE